MRSLWKQEDQIAVIFKGSEVIGITKSWLSEKIPDDLLDITGYKFLRPDRVQDIAGCKKRGGGRYFGLCKGRSLQACTDGL